MVQTEVQLSAGDSLALSYSVSAASGLRSVQLIECGREVEALDVDGVGLPTQVDFSVSPEADSWYSLVVEDMNGKFAYTNPVWVMVADYVLLTQRSFRTTVCSTH